jgi:hypothetical protein
MDMRKITLDNHDVFRKRHTQTNANVSYWHDEWSCEAQVHHLADLVEVVGSKKSKVRKKNFGISKREAKVSNRDLVDICRGSINGNSP